ncbi:MAG: hypothetical protein M3319_00355, partial [Actinomycetota bacterium]|nr:hypothetical protein [Actinomycetota bacterium]
MSATTQRMLSDPDGAALIRKAQEVLDKALRNRKHEVAEEAAAVLANLLEKEGKLRKAQAVSDDAQRDAVQVIVDELHRQGGS